MYTALEREEYLQELINRLISLDGIEGIIQIGSGVKGFTDEYSDIDLMVATNKNVHEMKIKIHHQLEEMKAFYIKEGKFASEIYLFIPFFNNGLEMNISILPTELLPVRSPLWRVIVDNTGRVKARMEEEMERFNKLNNAYGINQNIVFEYAYFLRKFKIELKRKNLIYAWQMLEQLRGFVIQVQVINEGKKLHQFKAYHRLNEDFLNELYLTYPGALTKEELEQCEQVTRSLFIEMVNNNEFLQWEEHVFHIANI